jgi:hypothetical protein
MKKLFIIIFILSACGGGEISEETVEVPTTVKATTTSTTTSTLITTTTSILTEVMPTVKITCEPVASDEEGLMTFKFEVTTGTNELVVLNIVSWFDSSRTDDLFISNGLPEPGDSNEFGYTVDNSFSQYEIEMVVMDSKDNFANDYCLYQNSSSSSTTTSTSTVADSTTTTVADSTTTSTTTTSTTTTTVVSVDYPQLIISEISSSIPEYDRDDWNHWIDENGDCQNTRHEVLIEETLETVTYTNDSYCLVSTGKWYGSYTGQYYYNASELDIDHFIPLKNAHQSGGYNWSSAKKEEFANYRLDPNNLIAVNLSANRSKGARGPDEWKPSNTEYWCEYAYDWIRIKDFWNLTATQAEWDALVSMIETCPPGFAYADAEEEPIVELPTTTTTTSSTTTTSTSTTTTVASSQPDNPGDTKNCGDFENYSEAKVWFDTYYEYYGDVANLDGDNDGEPCESLPGGP